MPLAQIARHSGPRADKSVATDEVNPDELGVKQNRVGLWRRCLNLLLRGDDVFILSFRKNLADCPWSTSLQKNHPRTSVSICE